MTALRFGYKNLKTIWICAVHNYSHWLSFVFLLIIAIVINPSFLLWSNITNLFVQGAIVGICAMGMSLVICAGMIDLCAGSAAALVSGFGVLVLNSTQSILLCFLFCLSVGFTIGLINGYWLRKAGLLPS